MTFATFFAVVVIGLHIVALVCVTLTNRYREAVWVLTSGLWCLAALQLAAKCPT